MMPVELLHKSVQSPRPVFVRLGLMAVPDHRLLTPDEFDKIDRWLERAFKQNGPHIDSISIASVLREDRKKNEPPAAFKARAQTFVANVLMGVARRK